MSHVPLADKISYDLELNDLISNSTHTDEIMESAIEIAENAGMTGTNIHAFALGYLANMLAIANS